VIPKTCDFGVQGLHFETWGEYFGDPRVPGDAPQEIWGSRSRFLSMLEGFGDPLGSHFGANLMIFLGSGAAKWQYGFWGKFLMDLQWKRSLYPMAACA